MEKITGIKSVDFKIVAKGHGVVNWNGSPTLQILVDGKMKKVSNHSIPKLRGYTNIEGKWDDGKPKYKTPEDIDFIENPLYISQNCVRYHLFKNDNFNLQDPELAENMDKLLCSLTGLIRGYVIPKKEYKRTSALLITDFNSTAETAKNGNFEQMGRSGSKEKEETKSGADKSTSLFSKTTFGETMYDAYASLSIEQLQFISLDDQFSRQSMKVNSEKESIELASKIAKYLQTIGNNQNVEATYHRNYVRKGSVFSNEKHGEAGILLNEEAIDILVHQVKHLLSNLTIRQGKGFMYIDSLEMDYNDSNLAKDMFRIKRDISTINNTKKSKYAIYFEGI